ncbi:hypothetical protein [Arthrobacter sp. B2a2-09]|uniref:hypothetical protein n=1 Tax=Arthrobacter sp. B2a2-09 TaxID=2952822 RepID=UPI0022CD7027|nr:hypothetical protein [Arthrobacter sp. B2a2-09]MCZ9882623.1 hypothetical protein [Arthrobacter sp. B2a2-09]
MNSDLKPLIPSRPVTRTTLVVLCGFTAALCWWIAIVGMMNSAAGTVVLTVPVLATIGTLLAARHKGHARKT